MADRAFELKKAWLKSYRAAKVKMSNLKRQMWELQLAYESPRSPVINGMPHGGSGENPMDVYLCKKEMLEERMKEQKEAMAIHRSLLYQYMDTCSPDERFVLEKRYIDGESWEDVRRAFCKRRGYVSYTLRTVYRYHNAGIEHMRFWSGLL